LDLQFHEPISILSIEETFNIPTELQQLINAEQAYHYQIVPFSKKNGNLVFKTDQKNTKRLQQELQIVLGNFKLSEESTIFKQSIKL